MQSARGYASVGQGAKVVSQIRDLCMPIFQYPRAITKDGDPSVVRAVVIPTTAREIKSLSFEQYHSLHVSGNWTKLVPRFVWAITAAHAVRSYPWSRVADVADRRALRHIPHGRKSIALDLSVPIAASTTLNGWHCDR